MALKNDDLDEFLGTKECEFKQCSVKLEDIEMTTPQCRFEPPPAKEEYMEPHVKIKIKEEPLECDEGAVISPGNFEHSIKQEYSECDDQPAYVQPSVKIEYEELDRLAETVYIGYPSEEVIGHKEQQNRETEGEIIRWSCQHCSYSTFKKSYLEHHLDTHLPLNERPYQCSYAGCNYAAIRKESLDGHKAKKHGEKELLLQCPHAGCHYGAAKNEYLNAHRAKQHGEEKYLAKCPYAGCNYATAYKSRLSHHKKTHTPHAMPFQCSYAGCNFGATEKRRLHVHLALQHGEKEYLLKCPHASCKYVSAHKGSLFNHVKSHASEQRDGTQDETPGCDEESKRWKCPDCSYSTSKKRYLEPHLQTHLSKHEKTFQCSHAGCNYAANKKEYLNAHKAKQHGEKKYLVECPHAGCKYVTAYKTHLSVHKKTHALMPYQCSYAGCNFGATEKRRLDAHLANQHGEKKYLLKCTHGGCRFTTAYKGNLSNHAKSHASEEPNDPQDEKKMQSDTPDCVDEAKQWRCHHCSFSTSKKRYLEPHLKTHLPQNEKKFQCSYAGCNYATIKKGLLLAHKAKQHGEKKYLVKCPHPGCNYVNAHKSLLWVHKKTHASEDPQDEKKMESETPGCDEEIKRLKSTSKPNHLETRLPQNEKTFECGYAGCNYAGAKKENLMAHTANQHVEKKYLKNCPHAACTFATAHRGSLDRHLKSHAHQGGRIYRCKHAGCVYSTGQLINLKCHAKSHLPQSEVPLPVPGNSEVFFIVPCSWPVLFQSPT